MKEYYYKTIEETLKDCGSSKDGLSSKVAEKRLEKYGKNELKEAKRKSLIRRFFEQMKDVMIIVLLIAAAVSSILAIIEQNYTDLIDAGIILLIVIINAIIGLVQEDKANQAMEALKNMNKPFAKVIRDGQIIKLKAIEYVRRKTMSQQL